MQGCSYVILLASAGYIGGRMVKWLEEITVTEGESNNFYHFHDNRVLPSHVTSTLAKEEGEAFPPEWYQCPAALQWCSVSTSDRRDSELRRMSQSLPYLPVLKCVSG